MKMIKYWIITIMVIISSISFYLVFKVFSDMQKEQFIVNTEYPHSSNIFRNIYHRPTLLKIDKDLYTIETNNLEEEKKIFDSMPVNCQGSWSDWICDKTISNCPITKDQEAVMGDFYKTYQVLIKNKNGGIACPNPLKIKGTTCSVNCPVDCQVTGGTESACICDGVNATSRKSKTFNISRTSKYGGKSCVDLVRESYNVPGVSVRESGNTVIVNNIDCKNTCPPQNCEKQRSRESACSPNAGATCDLNTGQIDGTKTIHYNKTKEAAYGGTCILIDTEACKAPCAVPCSGKWMSIRKQEEDNFCPVYGYKARKWNLTRSAKNTANTCADNGAIVQCPVNSAFNRGLALDWNRNSHCIQTKSWNDGYEGNPAEGWDLIYWYHDGDRGVKCFNDQRFRINFLNDGRIQSAYDNSLYVAPVKIEDKASIKWTKNTNTRWFVNGQNEIELYAPDNPTRYCISQNVGFRNLQNNTPVTLRVCESSSGTFEVTPAPK